MNNVYSAVVVVSARKMPINNIFIIIIKAIMYHTVVGFKNTIMHDINTTCNYLWSWDMAIEEMWWKKTLSSGKGK